MRRALGKGLSQLIAEQFDGAPQEAPVDAIVPNTRQPRTVFDEDALQDLASSIKQYGILQPLVVKPVAEGRYELIAGERRLRAAKLAGLKSVPILIRAAGDQASLELALIENIQREDIGPMECARAYRKLIDEFGLTQEQVAERVGKARTSVANTLRLMRLPTEIQEGLDAGAIQEGHARALLAFQDEQTQLAMYEEILVKGLTVREVERAAQGGVKTRAPKKGETAPLAKPKAEPHWAELEEALSTYLGAPVKLTKGEIGGKMTVEFYSDDDLERILSVLGITL